MNTVREDLETILDELAATRAREDDLLLRMQALVDDPALDLPIHVARVFARTTEVFGRDAARFLATAHWELGNQMPIRVAQDADGARLVEELLARISYGIPV